MRSRAACSRVRRTWAPGDPGRVRANDVTQLTLEDLVLKGPVKGAHKMLPEDWIHAGEGLPPSEKMIASIRAHGIFYPIIVNQREDGRYDVIDGARRLKAARSLGMGKVPAIVYNVPEHAVALLTAPVVLNEIRSDNLALACEHIDALFERGADEEVMSGALEMSAAKIRSYRSVWTSLITGLQDAFRSGQIKPGVARRCARLTKAEQARCFAHLEGTGGLTLRDVARIVGDAPTTASMDLPGEDDGGWKARARTAAFELELAARVGAQDNTTAAEFLARLVALLDEYGMRTLQFGGEQRAAADAVLNDEERDAFGSSEWAKKLSRDWRKTIMAGGVEQGLAGALAALERGAQDRLYHDWQTDDYVRANLDAALVRRYGEQWAAGALSVAETNESESSDATAPAHEGEPVNGE